MKKIMSLFLAFSLTLLLFNTANALSTNDSTTPTKNTAKITPQKTAKKTTLAGAEWKLVCIDKAGKLKSVPKDSKAKLQFDKEKGRLTGNGGCNNLHGSFKTEKDNISISKIGATRMYCQESSELETAFLSALEKVKKWEVKKGKLYLKSDTATLLVFQ